MLTMLTVLFLLGGGGSKVHKLVRMIPERATHRPARELTIMFIDLPAKAPSAKLSQVDKFSKQAPPGSGLVWSTMWQGAYG